MNQVKWLILVFGSFAIFLLIAASISASFQTILPAASNHLSTTTHSLSMRIRFVLLVRTCAAKAETMRLLLLHSLLIFWSPKRFGNLIVILDDESANDHIIGEQIQTTYNWITVKYERPLNQIYHSYGHHRTQWSNFYCDNYTDKEFVGIVDTDSLLVTLPTETNFFIDGKPIIQARIGIGGGEFWRNVPSGTHLALKLPEMARCMSYFPVIIKTQHFKLIRDYIAQKHGKSFDEVFQQFSKSDRYSQFNIMCNYLWYFHREEYEWRFWEDPPGWVTAGNPNTAEGQTKNYSHITFENTRPIVKTFIHYNHHSDEFGRLSQNRYIREGYCFCTNFTDRTLCNQTNRMHKTIFRFEGADWLYDSQGCVRAQDYHYRQVTSDIRRGLWNMTYIKEKVHGVKI